MPKIAELEIKVKSDGIEKATQRMINFTHACELATIAAADFVRTMEVLRETIKDKPE